MPRSTTIRVAAWRASGAPSASRGGFTSLMHHFPDSGDFGRRMQLAELDYLVRSKAASLAMAENYVGLPFDF